jgi:glycosyltransferase involved in cell wall biosynthesis
MMCVSGMTEGRRLGLPIVANYQTDLPGYARQHYGFNVLAGPLNRWLRYVHNRCHVNLVASKTTMQQLEAEGYRRLKLWQRGVDTVRFNPDKRSLEWRNKLLNGRDPSSLLCVYVGRLAPEKRVDLLIDVARLPDVALTIVGDGALREELETMFAGTGTHFTGYLYGDELAHAYASADLFIFPGPNETFGQVVQEAMASGLPCVVMNRGGVKDLVKPGHNGLHCGEDSLAFANAVESLRDNVTLRQQMRAKSRAMAEANPWQNVMSQLERHYQQAVDLNSHYPRISSRLFNELQQVQTA